MYYNFSPTAPNIFIQKGFKPQTWSMEVSFFPASFNVARHSDTMVTPLLFSRSYPEKEQPLCVLHN